MSAARNDQLQHAATTAVRAYTNVAQHARRLSEEIEEVTATDGTPVEPLDDEDSVVIAISAAIASHQRK